MSASKSDLVPWSRGRWWGMVLAVAVLQALFVLFLGERKPAVVRRARTPYFFTLISGAPQGSPIAELLEIGDPTLFALPDARNFSGLAWLVPRPVIRPSFGWTEPEQWLTQSVAELGTTVDELAKGNRLRYRKFDEKPPPVVNRVVAPPVPFPARSTVRIEGNGDRGVVALAEVPSIVHSDVLADTVVEAGITPSGFALSSVVSASSGSGTADQLALDVARSARFRPLPSRDSFALTWVVFTFRWHTSSGPSTNVIPAGTSP